MKKSKTITKKDNQKESVNIVQKLSQAKVQIPKTVFAYKPQNPDFLVDKVGGLPCIAKTIKGSQGVGVMILESKLQRRTF